MIALIIITTLNINTMNDGLWHSMHIQTLQCYLHVQIEHIYQILPYTMHFKYLYNLIDLMYYNL